MNLPLDIHTHRLPTVPGRAIVNCYPEAFVPQEGGWYSVGIHPWYIGNPDYRPAMAQLVFHPQVLAVGEAGLDKLAEASLAQQIEVFEFQALLAEEAGKPLIVHLVKAVDELLKLKQTLRPTLPWVIHGFRGKAALAEVYLRHGFYLSFGERYQEEALCVVPIHRLLLETDESALPIEEVYTRAAALRGVPAEELGRAVQGNVRHLFFKVHPANE